MKNYFIIAIIVVAIGYMFVIMKDKYDSLKDTNQKISQQKTK